MNLLKYLITAVIIAVSPLAEAQVVGGGVEQSGTVVLNNAACWVSNGLIKDCGVAPGGSLLIGTTTISGGANGRIEFNNSGVLGELAIGNGLSTAGSALNLTTTDTTKTSSYQVVAGDMASALNLAGTTGTLTLPVASSTIFAPGMSLSFVVTASGNWTLTNSTGLTLTGLNSTTLAPGTSGTFVANANGTGLDFFPGMQMATALSIGGISLTPTLGNTIISDASGTSVLTLNSTATHTSEIDYQIAGSQIWRFGYDPVNTKFFFRQTPNASTVFELSDNAIADAVIGNASGLGTSQTGQIGWEGAALSSAFRASFSNPASAVIHLGASDVAAPIPQTFGVQSAIGGTVNAAGADWKIVGSLGTGNAVPGRILLQTGTAHGSDNVVQTATTGITLDGLQHNSYGGSSPALSGCGTSPSIDGNATDTSGTVTVGSVATGCVITFSKAYITFNHCVVTSQGAVSGITYVYTKTSITISASVLGGDLIDYRCDGA